MHIHLALLQALPGVLKTGGWLEPLDTPPLWCAIGQQAGPDTLFKGFWRFLVGWVGPPWGHACTGGWVLPQVMH